MNKLTINHGSFNLDEIDLDHGTITIGRASDNDIRLDDSAVSSHHAKIVTFFNVTYIEDLDSTNGTIVNGRVVKKYTLRTGDIVLLGKHQLLFQGSPAPDEKGNSDATVVMSQTDVKNAMANKPEDGIPAFSSKPAAATYVEDAGAANVLSPERVASPSPSPVAAASPAPAAPQPNHASVAHLDQATRAKNEARVDAKINQHPEQFTERPMRAVMDNIASNSSSADSAPITAKPLDSLESHNEAFSLLSDSDDADINKFSAQDPFAAFGKDESLLIPAFIKAEKTSLNKPSEQYRAPTPPPTAPVPPPVNRQPIAPPEAAAPTAPPKSAPFERPAAAAMAAAPEVEALKSKPARKVLEDPSVSFGNPMEHSAPMGINEIDRVHQYRQKSNSTNPGAGGMPAVGDRTLLKQIITGDSAFSPSSNKFEIIQIVLGFVIFSIIALIVFASF